MKFGVRTAALLVFGLGVVSVVMAARYGSSARPDRRVSPTPVLRQRPYSPPRPRTKIVLAPPRGGDDTERLQAALDRGERIVIPRSPDGRCYRTRGLWVSRNGTSILSDGACLLALGPGPVRLRSGDGDPVAASAVLYVNRSSNRDRAPRGITIEGLRIVVPNGVACYGIGIFGHHVSVQHVRVGGSPIDDVIVGGRANGDDFASDVTIRHSRLTGGRRNVMSVTSVVGLDVEDVLVAGASDTWLVPSTGRFAGNPAAGIDLEPDDPLDPILDVRIAHDRIRDNAGPGILLALRTASGLPLRADRIEILDNQIVGNGRGGSTPQRSGIVLAGGQADGRGRVGVRGNVIRANRGAGLEASGREAVRILLEAEQNDLDGNGGGATSLPALPGAS